MPQRVGTAGLSADEIGVLQRAAMGYMELEILEYLNMPTSKLRRIESSVRTKLTLAADTEDWLFEAGRLYREYGLTIGFTTRMVRRHTPKQSHKRERPVNGAQLNTGLGAKYATLPPNLLEVARLIADGSDNFGIANTLRVSINDAGTLVSKLYGSLGFERSLKKERRIEVRRSYPLFVASLAAKEEESTLPKPEDVATRIGLLSRDERNVLAEVLYADGDEAKAAKSLRITPEALVAHLVRMGAVLDLQHLDPELQTQVLKDGWQAYRTAALSKPKEPPSAPPAAPRRASVAPAPAAPRPARSGLPLVGDSGIDVSSLRLMPPIVHALRDPNSIVGAHVVSGVMNGVDPPDFFAARIENMRQQGYEPEIAVTIPAENGKVGVMQLLFVKRGDG